MLNGNYVDSNEDLVVKPEVQESTSADFVVPNVEMPQEENNAIEETPISFEIPKFEDLFKTNENELVNEEVIIPEEKTENI